jgi:hypothetical protein
MDVPDEQARCIRSALWSLATGEPPAVDIFTPDVVCSSPLLEARGRDDLLNKIADRRGGLTDVTVRVDRMEGDGTAAAVSWRMAGDHTGAILLNEDVLLEPSGLRLALTVFSTFTLRGASIAMFRNEFDVDALARQFDIDVPSFWPSNARDY